MTREESPLKRLVEYLKTHKAKSIIIGLGLLLVVLYSLVFFIPKQVTFSYSGESCASHVTLLPGIHKPTDADQFTVLFNGEVKLGSVVLASTKTCFQPVSEPKQGKVAVGVAPFGGFVARKNFTVTTLKPPVVNASSFEKPVPVSKPLKVDLSAPDEVFRYRLKAGDNEANCTKSGNDLDCDVPVLELGQGKEYKLALTRQFKDEEKKVLLEKKITTLRAVTIKEASVKNKQIIYNKPTSFTFVADKPLAGAKVALRTAEKNPKDIEVKTRVDGNKLVVSFSSELEREKDYALTLLNVEAADGSTLVDPRKTVFTMSGGPKVTGVNIGASRVGSSAVAVIQFDQKISPKTDISKYVSIAGGSAVITRHNTSVSVALQGLPRCKQFTLKVASGMLSEHNIQSKNAWQFTSRTICYSLVTYGTSVQGRPLHAYIFGNTGPVTMYTGAIHGNESSSSGLMQAWINELEANPGKIGARRIVVIPTINPDGLAANTRNNSRNVNLSRNFPTDNWTKDINDTNGKIKGGGGKKPLSEPEASALAAITRQYRPRLLLSFHAIGSLVVGDAGGYSAGYAAKYASIVGYSNATGNSSGTFDYDITGAYEDWAYRNEGIPSMVIELGSYSSYYIDHHRAALWAML